MNITGRLFGVGSVPPRENGLLFMVATDGTHHALAYGGTFTNDLQVCEGESLAKHFTIGEFDFRADVAAEFPALSLSGWQQRHDISFPGTPFFVMIEAVHDSVSGFDFEIGLKYQINASGDISIVNKYKYYINTTAQFIDSGIGGAIVGVTIGDWGYFITQVGDFFFGLFQCVIKLPLVGDGIDDLPPGAVWASQIEHLPGPVNEVRAPGDVNGSSLWPAPLVSAVGVFTYQCFGMPHYTGAPHLWHTMMLDAGGNTGSSDVGALFGVPFPDAQLDFAGNPDPSQFNDYQSPSVFVLADGRIEFTFIRRYLDQPKWLGVRRFIAANDLSSVVALPFFQFQLTSENPLNGGVQLNYSFREGDDVCFMIFDFTSYIFKTMSLPFELGRRRWFAEPGPIRRIL